VGTLSTRRNIYPLTPIMVINHPLSASSICYDLGILSVQFTCLTVFLHNLCPIFFGLPLCLAPSISYSKHFFIQSLSSFHSTCPYHRNLFCCITKVVSSNPSPSFNPLLGTLSCSLMPHIHLTILTSASEVPPHFPFLWARSHLHATAYFIHNFCTNNLLTINIYPYW